MAKKQHLSKIESAMTIEIEKLRMESSQPSGDLPTTAAVNESIERLTTTPKRIEKAVETVINVAKSKKVKEDIERGRSAKGELNRTGITALIDRDLLKDVKIFALQKGVSMSDIINDALIKYLTI
jgi:predicted amidohydrolase YtcJ